MTSLSERAVSRKPVLMVLGSDSDLPVAKGCATLLREFGVGYHLTVSSAHRTPERTVRIAQEAASRGFLVVVAFAGAAAALPGVIAAHTRLPVIGVPISGKMLSGLDALLSMVQMPGGVPVGVVGMDNGKNAALLALRILALDREHAWISPKLEDYMKAQAAAVEEKARALEEGMAVEEGSGS